MNRKNEKTLSVSEQYNVAKAKKSRLYLYFSRLFFVFRRERFRRQRHAFVQRSFSCNIQQRQRNGAAYRPSHKVSARHRRAYCWRRSCGVGACHADGFENPLASPTTLGVSNAAVFGANFAIIVVGAGAFHSTHGSWLSISNPYLVSTFSFLSAIIAAGSILLLARLKNLNASAIVLAGVAVSAIFQAGTTLIQYFASDTQVASAVYWTFGDLGRASYKTDLIMFIVVAVSTLFFFLKRWDFSAMSGGIAYAKPLA